MHFQQFQQEQDWWKINRSLIVIPVFIFFIRRTEESSLFLGCHWNQWELCWNNSGPLIWLFVEWHQSFFFHLFSFFPAQRTLLSADTHWGNSARCSNYIYTAWLVTSIFTQKCIIFFYNRISCYVSLLFKYKKWSCIWCLSCCPH